MKLQNRLLFFFIVTGSGSILSAIATFVRIEWIFSSVGALGLALSIKTLAALLVSRLAEPLLSRVGTKRALIYSQLMGLGSIGTLYAGFHLKNLTLLLFGIGLSSIPFVLVNVGVISQGRILCSDEKVFRNFSAKMQGALGSYFLVGSLLVPILLKLQGIEIVFSLDALSYIAGIWILNRMSDVAAVKIEEPHEHGRNWIETLYSHRKFLLFTGAPLLLSALAPLLASSHSIPFTQGMPGVLRESLWSVEAITILLSGVLYGLFHHWIESKVTQGALMLSSVALGFLLFSSSPVVVGLVMLLNALLFNIAFLKGRDDLIASQGMEHRRIKSLSSLAFGYKSLAQAISPLFLTWVLTAFRTNEAVGIIFGIQFLFLLGWVSSQRRGSMTEEVEDSSGLCLAMGRNQ